MSNGSSTTVVRCRWIVPIEDKVALVGSHVNSGVWEQSFNVWLLVVLHGYREELLMGIAVGVRRCVVNIVRTATQ